MGIITIVPTAGLANRLRALASGVFIAKFLKSEAEYYWVIKRECKARFEDLFQPISSEIIRGYSVSPFHFFCAPPSKKNLYLPALVRKLFYSKEINNFNKRDGNICGLIPSNGKIYLSSYHSMSEHYPLNELFVPTAEIQLVINNVYKKFSKNVVGLHIRRTDNLKAIKKNSIDDFKKRINQELENNRDTKFYLATDSEDVKKELITIYGEKIITYEASLRRDTLDGMKDAVVDLWCLSSTKYIIGSFYSSYSEIAAELGEIELVIL